MASPALLGMGSGLAEGKAAAQKDAIQKDYYAALKKKMQYEVDFAERRQALLNSLPPEQQALAQFPGLAKDPQNQLIQAILPYVQSFMQGGEQQDPVQQQGMSGGVPGAGLPEEIASLAGYAEDYHGLPKGLVSSVIKAESSGNPRAVSPKGAMGLMQLMPGTAQDLGVTDPYHPQQNVMGGSRYLADQIREFGSPDAALAAYYTGPDTVRTKGITPEARGYIAKVLGQPGARPAAPSSGLSADPRMAFAMNAAGVKTDAMEQNSKIVGDNLVFTDKYGNITRAIPIPPEFDKVDMTDTEGRKATGYIQKPSRGLGGATAQPPTITSPSPLDMRSPVPGDIEKKITEEDANLRTYLQSMGEIVSQDPSVLGLAAKTKYDGSKTWASGALNAAGLGATPNMTEFYQITDKLLGHTIHEFAGANVTRQELKRAIATLPSAMSSQQDFLKQIQTILELSDKYRSEIYDYYTKSPRERQEIDRSQKSRLPAKPPASPSATTKPTMIYNPATGAFE